MNKKCEFNLKKLCDSCGECNICDLDSKKNCDNCGKCLEPVNGSDARGIEIDEILEDESQYEEIDYSPDSERDTNEPSCSSDFTYEFLEDHKHLNEMISDLKDKEEELSDNLYEAYPGLIIIGRKKENLTDQEDCDE